MGKRKTAARVPIEPWELPNPDRVRELDEVGFEGFRKARRFDELLQKIQRRRRGKDGGVRLKADELELLGEALKRAAHQAQEEKGLEELVRRWSHAKKALGNPNLNAHTKASVFRNRMLGLPDKQTRGHSYDAVRIAQAYYDLIAADGVVRRPAFDPLGNAWVAKVPRPLAPLDAVAEIASHFSFPNIPACIMFLREHGVRPLPGDPTDYYG